MKTVYTAFKLQLHYHIFMLKNVSINIQTHTITFNLLQQNKNAKRLVKVNFINNYCITNV